MTLKQEKFVEELIKGKSQREAYKAAFNCSRMKPETIDSNASRLLKKDKVAARFTELRGLTDQKAGDDATSIRAKLIEQWKKIANVNQLDYYEEHEDPKYGKQLKCRTDIENLDGRLIKDVKVNQYGKVIGYTFYDKDKALEKLQELYGVQPKEESEDQSIRVTFDAGLEDAAV